MKNIRRILLLVILVLILIGVASATESTQTTSSTELNQAVDDTQTVSQADIINENKNVEYINTPKTINTNSISDVEKETIQTNDTSEEVNQNKENIKIILKADENSDYDSFTNLQKLIDDASEGDEIELNNDYSISEGGNPIKISKSITINGNNHTLSGDYQDSILSITKDEKSIVLKNIIFEEAYTKKNGSAILNTFSSTSLTLINCVLQYNSASNITSFWDGTYSGGGAVYTKGNMSIINSTFKRNTVTNGRGGAVYCYGTLFINNSSFLENLIVLGHAGDSSSTGGGYGGAINCLDKCTIINSEFRGNTVGIDYTVTGTYGGAIYSWQELTIYNTTFTENEAKYDNGGAIYCESNLYGTNLTFTNNKAYCGGAIYCKGETHLYNSQFSENKHVENSTKKDKDWLSPFPADPVIPVDPSEGGAIYSEDDCYIDSCIFNDNFACEVGGAIFAQSDLTITGQNSFSNNQAARHFYFDQNILSWRWIDKMGGAIYCKGNAKIENANFTNNNAFVDGGAIYGEGKTTVVNCNFKDNKASGIELRGPMGGAIRSKGTLTVENSNFENNIAITDGGAIYADSKTSIYNSTFKKNKAIAGLVKNYGGAVYSKGTITIDESSFEDNQVDHYGGAVYAVGNIIVNGSNFSANTVNKIDGGAIYSEGDTTIDNSIFTKNTVEIDGGAVFSNGKTKIYNSKFQNNKALGIQAEKSYGGAVCSKGTMTIDNSIFEDNHSNRHGGAAYAHTDVTITKSTFKGNDANGDGGAVYGDKKTSISNSIFSNNKALGKLTLERSFGGAILSNGLTTVKNSVFEDNNAHNQGGAIYADNEIIITGSNFTDNSAKQAGAVYTSTITQKVTDSNFKNNKATTSPGGAIYINNKCNPEFSYCTFEENTCNGDGGAIYLDSSSAPIKISYCSFNDNKADVDGGAIYSKAETTISYSEFDGNEATGKTASRSFGGAIRSNGLVTLTNTNFTNNYADNYGGAVYADGEIRITGCNFEWNGAKTDGGAIYTSTIDKKVSHSIFIGNNANKGDGGAIYINNNCDPEFVSCRFENNIAHHEGGAIRLDSSRAEITVSYCTFVDNDASSGKSIYDCGYYNIVDRCWFGKNNPDLENQFKIWHKAASDEDYYPKNDLKIEMTINDTELYVGNTYHVTVYFYVSKIFPIKLTEDLLHSEGKFYGDGEFSNVIASSPNNMTADVVFTKENPKIYLKLDHQVVSLSLDVKEKATSEVQILSCDDVKYPNTLKVNYQITNMTDNSRYLISTLDGIPVVGGKITDSKSTITVDNLDIGKYTIDIINGGNKSTKPSKDTAKFIVYDYLSTVIVTADNVTYSENTTITLKADHDGLYNVAIDRVDVGIINTWEFDVINGICERQFGLTPAGNYQTHTTPVNNNTIVNCTEAFFTLYRANPNFKLHINSSEYTYGEDVIVTHELTYSAGGSIQYYINNEWYDELDGRYDLELKNLSPGSYSIRAVYSGDINYLNDTDSISFTVNKPYNNVVVSVDNVTYGEKTYIEIHADVNGMYQVDVNGTVYNMTVSYGIGITSLILNAGVYYANVTFDNDNYITTTENATFVVNKADIDLVIVVFDEVYPDEPECIIYSSKDGEYTLNIAGYSTTITVKDNIAYYEHSTLDVGRYQAFVSYDGDNNYNPAFNTTNFTVYPAGTLFEIEVNPGEVFYGKTATVTHTLSEDATGTIKYYLNNNTFLDELSVDENLNLPVLDVGRYAIIASYSGDYYHVPANDSTYFIVKPVQNNVMVKVDNVTYGEDSLIEVTADVDGVYTVDVNGTIVNVTVTDGVGNESINLNAGKYYANLTFNNKNYNTKYTNAYFEVYKANATIVIVAEDITYPQELEGKINSNIDGNYNLTVDNYSTTVIVENGEGQFNAGVLNANSYNITVNYPGDKNHNSAENNRSILVNPASNKALVMVNNVTYGEDSLIEITADIDGYYQLDVNGMLSNITISNGTGNISLRLDAGKYYANVSFDNKNYNTTYNNSIFEVYKADTNIVIVASNRVYPHEIDGLVYSNVDGNYDLRVGNYLTTLTIKDGIGRFNAGVFDAGEYNVSVSYAGDLNHMANSSVNTVVVNKFTPDILLNVSDIDYGEVETIRIFCDVPGSVNVTVNNKTETLILKNQMSGLLIESFNALNFNYGATLSLEDLNSSSYPVIVVYNGDINYESVNTYGNFEVYALNVTMDIKANDINVGEDENITVKLSSKVNGTVTITVDGENYTKPVDDGKAIVLIPNLTAGYKNATVYYSGDLNHNPANDTVSFTVYKIESIITISDYTSYFGDKVTFTARITDKQKNNINGGKVVFKLNGLTLRDENGEKIYARVHDGIASISYVIPANYHSKSYQITAVYGENNKYLGSRSNNQTLYLNSRQAKLTVTVNDDVQVNQNITFHVKVTDQRDLKRAVNGHVIFKIDGLTLKDDNNETLLVPITDNTVDFSYLIGPQYSAREHTITAVLINNTYLRSQENNTFNVNMTQTMISLDKISTSTNTAQLTGKITDTMGNNVIGTDKIIVKLDGFTIKTQNNTVQYYNSTDGQINITLDTSNLNSGKHNIEVVTQQRSAYTGSRNHTTFTIKNNTSNSTSA